MARRLLIDAMNVIGSRPDGWWTDRDRAMRSLAHSLHEYARLSGDEITVVFDSKPKPAPETGLARVAVASRKGRNAADHEIVEIVKRDDDRRNLQVVTSDKTLVERVTHLGATVLSSRTFRDHMEEAVEQGRSV